MSDAAVTFRTVATRPFPDQKPGTSGLRKQTAIFKQDHYLANFVQSIFDALPEGEVRGKTLVVAGDGRHFVREAAQQIIKIAAANGLMSTPAVSAVIREREGGVAYGGIILTASHNPGGVEGDFGVKYNVSNGGPAPESVTDKIYQQSRIISAYYEAEMPEVDLDRLGVHSFFTPHGAFVVEVIDPTEDYVTLMRSLFDFDALRRLFARPDFTFLCDALNGVGGPYAKRIFCEELGASESSLRNCTPLEDFGGLHPDPNLTYAEDLVKTMGLDPRGMPLPDVEHASLPAFGAAMDGDADRAMILGAGFFVSPSDSVAVLAANAQHIPFFRSGLKGVARSMPTSVALDLVAAKHNIPVFEVPTGWKYFGNLMDSGSLGKEDFTPFICGEESFGCGSNHIREKDGIWAVLAWLSVVAARNTDASAPLVGVQQIVEEHWSTFGRTYYSRYDYEGVSSDSALLLMARLGGMVDLWQEEKRPITLLGTHKLVLADQFQYRDPVDGSMTANQGTRFIFEDGSRFVFRLSGTGSVGATIRLYLEKHEAPGGRLNLLAAEALQELVALAQRVSKVNVITGRAGPTVIT